MLRTSYAQDTTCMNEQKLWIIMIERKMTFRFVTDKSFYISVFDLDKEL